MKAEERKRKSTIAKERERERALTDGGRGIPAMVAGREVRVEPRYGYGV